MADPIVVHFTVSNKTLKAVVDDVKAILVLPNGVPVATLNRIKRDFAMAHGLQFEDVTNNKLPPGLVVKQIVKKDGLNEFEEIDSPMNAGDPGPGVCYLLEGQIVCW